MRKLLPLLALTLACLSCDAPFNLSYSQAAAVASRMTLRQTLAPVYGLEGDREDLDILFLPEKEATAPGIDFQNGFLLLRETNRTILRYVQYTAAEGSYRAFGWWDEGMFNPDPNYLPFSFEPLKYPTPTDSAIGLVGMDPVDPQNSSVQVLNANYASSSFLSSTGGWLNLTTEILNSSAIVSGTLYDANVLGFSIYPTDAAQPFDTMRWLVRMISGIDAGKLREIAMDAGAGALSNKADTKPGAIAFDIPELAAVNRCHYFHDPDPIRGPTPDDRKSYASWFDAGAGSWRCVRWSGTGFADSMVLTGVTHRIDALLTTGRLFSTEEEIARVYDSSGTETASFPLGALRFIGEREVDGQPLALFSLARIVTEKDSTALAIDVYSIPPADLEMLGE